LSREIIPDYLVIGHILKDISPQGAMLGGTASYAGRTAANLGLRTAAVTSYGPDLPPPHPLRDIDIQVVPSPHSTTFKNSYHNGKRSQKWFTTASPLSFNHIPTGWRYAPIVHLAPMAQEISPALCGNFAKSLLCVTMQGWLRGQDNAHNVIYQPHPDLEKWLARIDILVLSLTDVQGDQDRLEHFLNTAQLGVETLGPEGCRVHHRGSVTHIPVQPIDEVDPTGAGDIFAAAFFIWFRQSRDIIEAAQFANACASLSVTGFGIESVPLLGDVKKQMSKLYGKQTYHQ
jgi:hypothetical protein